MSEQSAKAPKPPIAAAVIVDRDRVLLVRRRVAEGTLSWAFPSGAIEVAESAPDAAVRETAEETGLTVAARLVLGERVHPATKRHMSYVACDVVAGTARVADAEELAEVVWCEIRNLPAYIPHGVFEPVQRHLDSVLAA